MELGLSYLRQNDFTNARIWLEKSRRDYSGYLLETILHFRVHAAIRLIKSREQQLLTDSSNSLNSASTQESSQPPSIDKTCEAKVEPLVSHKPSFFEELYMKMHSATFGRKHQGATTQYEDFLDDFQTKL